MPPSVESYVKVRVTPSQKARWREAAAEAQQPVGEFLRKAVEQRIVREQWGLHPTGGPPDPLKLVAAYKAGLTRIKPGEDYTTGPL